MSRPVFRRQGILFVVSAPSGTGKTTLCENLRATPDFIYSVSCTTRPPRPGEVDGVDYHFLSREDFQRKIDRGEMLEYAEVHGNYYGTLKETVREALAVDLRKRTLSIQKNVKTIAVLAPKVMEHHRGTLLERAAKAGLEIGESDERLLKEIVFFADRSDISEELTRLRSHLDQFFTQLGKDEPVGRTLDFLLQEMFRETNTIGNKANFLAISQIIVGMKTELEKLREQVQNIE